MSNWTTSKLCVYFYFVVLAVNKAPVWDITSMNKIRETFTKQVYENTTESKWQGEKLFRLYTTCLNLHGACILFSTDSDIHICGVLYFSNIILVLGVEHCAVCIDRFIDFLKPCNTFECVVSVVPKVSCSLCMNHKY